MSDDLTPPLPDVRVAHAMDRVLECEHAAEAAVAECEHACADILDRAREQGRAILERAQARIVALHTRAAKGLERRAAQIAEQRRKSAAATIRLLSDPARRSAAIERLAAQLTTEGVGRVDN